MRSEASEISRGRTPARLRAVGRLIGSGSLRLGMQAGARAGGSEETGRGTGTCSCARARLAIVMTLPRMPARQIGSLDLRCWSHIFGFLVGGQVRILWVV